MKKIHRGVDGKQFFYEMFDFFRNETKHTYLSENPSVPDKPFPPQIETQHVAARVAVHDAQECCHMYLHVFVLNH